MSKFVVSLVLSSVVFAQQPQLSQPKKSASSPSTNLPVQRVVLYKSGVGYFEHRGKVRGNQDITLRVAASQLDDVLKSLVALDLGNGQITAVRYDSVAPRGDQFGPPPPPPDPRAAMPPSEQDMRNVTISTAGKGVRDIVVSYITEVPIWKTSYRILLSKDSPKAVVYGWALVDNTVARDWSKVRLALSTGGPRSFVQPTSLPQYAQRPVIAQSVVAVNVPETHQSRPNAPDDPRRDVSVPHLYPGSIAMPRNAYSYPDCIIGSAPCSMSATRSFVPSAPPPVPGLLSESGAPTAEPIEYALPHPITIGKDQSALLPIVNAQLEAEDVTLFTESQKLLRAVWLTNSSDVALDSGTFGLVIDNEFAGEGLIKPIKPGERRLLSYGSDPSVTATAKNTKVDSPLTFYKVVDGVAHARMETRETRTYSIRTVGPKPSGDIIVEHPAREGWKLTSRLKPEETTANLHRFRIKAGLKSATEVSIEEIRLADNKYDLVSFSLNSVRYEYEDSKLGAVLEPLLRKVAEMRSAADGILLGTIPQKEQEMADIQSELATLRADIEMLRGNTESSPLLQRYLAEFTKGKTRVDELRTEIRDLKAKHKVAQEALVSFVRSINVN
jgi:hypothetical protein